MSAWIVFVILQISLFSFAYHLGRYSVEHTSYWEGFRDGGKHWKRNFLQARKVYVDTQRGYARLFLEAFGDHPKTLELQKRLDELDIEAFDIASQMDELEVTQ